MPYRPQSPIRLGEDNMPPAATTTPNYGTHSTLYLDPGDRLMMPMDWGMRYGETITHISVYLGAGGTQVDSLDVRLEEMDTDGPTGTLIDANATGTIANVGGAAGWVKIPINGGTGVVVNYMNPAVVFDVGGAVGQVRFQYAADYAQNQRARAMHAPRTWDGSDWDAVITVGGLIIKLWDGATVSQFPHLCYDVAMSFEAFDSASANPFQGIQFDIDFDGKVSGIHGWMYAVNDMMEIDVIVLLNGVEVSQRNVFQGHTRRYQDGLIQFLFPEVTVANGDTIDVIFNPTNTHDKRIVYFDTSDADVSTILGNYMTARYRRGATLGTLATVADRRPIMDLLVSEIDTGGACAGYPSEDDVRDGTVFGNANEFTGNMELPAANQVANGVGYGTNGTELTGDVVAPVENDVRLGVNFGSGSALSGNVRIPDDGDVRLAVPFDVANSGDCRVPPPDKVELGYNYDDQDSVTGTLAGGGGGGTKSCTSVIVSR